MSATRLSWLLRLYPRAWRRRYADEFADLLATEHPTPRLVLDLALGALDAHVCPQLAGGRREAGGIAGLCCRLSPSASRLRAMIALALIVLVLLLGGLRHTGEFAQAGAAIADHLGPVATAGATLTNQDYSRPALRHD
jgi:hypothetical protein